MGGKLLTTSTLETLYSRGVYQTMFDVSNSQSLLTRTPGSTDKNKGKKSKQEKARVDEQKAEQRRLLHLQNVLENSTEELEAEILFKVSAADKVLELKDKVTHVAFSRDCRLLALARADGIVSIVETCAHAKDWKPVHSANLHYHHDAINYTSFRPADTEAYLPEYVRLECVSRVRDSMSMWHHSYHHSMSMWHHSYHHSMSMWHHS
jgi:hypothetical protein